MDWTAVWEGGGRLSLVVLVSEKPNLVSEKSGKSQGILFICGAGNPATSGCAEPMLPMCQLKVKVKVKCQILN